MIVWDAEDRIDKEPTPHIFCDICGQECNVYSDGHYVQCDEIDGKDYCEDCLRENANSL